MLTRSHRDKIDRWIEAINGSGKNLSKWEDDFVASIEAQLTNTGTLSERQEEILERIYSEKTPG